MKKLSLVILTILLTSQLSLRAAASQRHWNSDVTKAVAQAIVEGRQPPLSAAELADLDTASKQQLLIDLAQAQARQGTATDQSSNDGVKDQPTERPKTENGPDQPDQTNYARQSLDQVQHNFLQQLIPLAQNIGKQYDLFPSVLLAQAALESDWGRSDLSSNYHNLFGIKGSGYFSIKLPTQEEQAGQLVSQMASFRVYPNWQASLEDYAKVLNQPLYAGVHRKLAANYRQATHALIGKYASDSQYDRKLNQVIQAYHLDQYDQLKEQDSQPVKVKNPHQLPADWPDKTVKGDYSAASKAHSSAKEIAWPWPVLGGCGSVGLWQVLRRHWL